MAFPDRMKEARLAAGMTQEKLAQAIGVAKSTYTGYEKGNSEPNILVQTKIMEVLGIDANFLFQDEVKRHKDSTASPWEMEHLVKKYRLLDEYGKEAVITILDCEIERMNRSQEVVELSPGIKVLKIAGRDGSFREIHLTEEQRNAFHAYLNQLQLQDASDIL